MADAILNELSPVFMGGVAPEQLHSGQFQSEGKWGSNPALKRASEVSGSAFERLNALHELRVNRTEDPYAHAQKLKRLVGELGTDWARQWDDVKAGLKRERNRVESELTNKANLKQNAAHFNAIVGTFSGLSLEQRMKVIDQALEQSDGPTLATLAEAPSLVTGLDAEQRANIRIRAFTKADPNSYALLQELDKALVRAERASLACIDAQTRLVQGTDKFERKAERSRQLESQLRTTM